MYLLDTGAISVLRRGERQREAVRWLSAQQASDLFLGVVTIGEIERGIGRQTRRNPPFAQDLAAWLAGILTWYEDRILPVDVPTARRWGRLCADSGHNSYDLLIAATALERGLTVVTRNTCHFEPAGVPVLNLNFSPRGEAKWVRGPSGRGASRLARAGVLEQYVEHGK